MQLTLVQLQENARAQMAAREQAYYKQKQEREVQYQQACSANSSKQSSKVNSPKELGKEPSSVAPAEAVTSNEQEWRSLSSWLEEKRESLSPPLRARAASRCSERTSPSPPPRIAAPSDRSITSTSTSSPLTPKARAQAKRRPVGKSLPRAKVH